MDNNDNLIALKGAELLNAIEQVKEKVLQSADIVEVISSAIDNVDIMSNGNFSCSCCFHSQSNPSVVIKPEQNTFDCYGCGARGNSLDFVFFSLAKENPVLKNMLPSQIISCRDKTLRGLVGDEKANLLKIKNEIKKLYDKSYVLLADRIEEIKGYPILSDGEKYILDYKKNRQYEIMRETAKFYYNVLRNDEQGSDAMKYCMEKRGFSRTVLDEMGVGYAPADAYFKLGKHLKNLGYSEMEIEGAGVVKTASIRTPSGADSLRLYDVFIDRVIVPIKDTEGRVVGLGGRLVSDNAKYAKYINTASTSEIYQKREILYNFDKASATKTKHDEVILCEGMLDCVSAQQALYSNCVASCGTALTEEHADLLASTFKIVIIAYDNDEAGNKAFKRAKEMLEGRGLEVHRVDLSSANVKDFNQLLCEKGEQGFSSLFSEQEVPTHKIGTFTFENFGKANAVELRKQLKSENISCNLQVNAKGDVIVKAPDFCENTVRRIQKELAQNNKNDVTKKKSTVMSL